MIRAAVVVLVLVAAGAAGLPGPAAAGPSQAVEQGARTTQAAPLDRFVRVWVGHTRSLRIRADRTAKATVFSGCCDHVIDVRFRVVRAHGTQHRGRVRAEVTRVHVFDPEVVGDDRPHRGDRVTFRVRRGVLHDPATGTSYCNDRAGRRGACGA